MPFTGGFEAIVTRWLFASGDTVMQPVAWVTQKVGRDDEGDTCTAVSEEGVVVGGLHFPGMSVVTVTSLPSGFVTITTQRVGFA